MLTEDTTVPLPLAGHALISTRDLRAAQDAVSREIGAHRFTRASAADTANVRMSCARLPRTRIFGVQLGSNIVATTAAASPLQLVVPLAGTVAPFGDTDAPVIERGSALVHPPGVPVNLLWGAHCVGIVIWFAPAAVDDLMLRSFGFPMDADLPFRTRIDLSSGAGLSVADALGTILRELDDPSSLLSRGITTRTVEDLLATSLPYAALDDSGHDRARPRSSVVMSVHLRRAVEFIRSHLQDDVGVDQITDAAGVSLRTLQYEFARHFGVGPITMLRRERLKRVRGDLLRGETELSIGDLAARWGFFDAKYFAKVYFREFGERPSQTRSGREHS